MADDATPETTPGHPDAVVINDDGSVTTRGGRGFVWVTEDVTGARYDVPASMLPRSGLTPVPGYPVNYRPVGRTAKSRLRLSSDPAAPTGDAGESAGVPAGGDPGVAAGEPDTSKPKQRGRAQQ